MPENNFKPPSGTQGDTAHLLARVGISAIPGIGGTALEMFNALIVPPLERRRNEWIEQMALVVESLNSRVSNLEDLKINDDFIDAVIKASRIAVSNNQQEKIEALKNAVVNSALPGSPDRSLQQVFFNYVDIFTIFHLKILDLFSRQEKLTSLFQRGSGDSSAAYFINIEIPELSHENDLTNFVWTDLNTKGLLKSGQPLITPRGGNGYLVIKHTTDFGDKFLSFIGKPV